ncbi:MAG: TRAP transporter small permease [Dehalococcoidia bacterium]|nr:TRAP transporter small permease [Dehalococcoidia bacterium]
MSDNNSSKESMFIKIHNSVVEHLAVVGGLLVFVMSIVTTSDVTGRGFFKTSFPGAYEVTGYLMVLVVFFSVAYLQSQKGNVRVDLLTNKLGQKAQLSLHLLGTFVSLFVFVLVIYTGAKYFWSSWVEQEIMYGVRYPLWIIKFAVPFGSFFMCTELIIEIGRTIKQLAGRAS